MFTSCQAFFLLPFPPLSSNLPIPRDFLCMASKIPLKRGALSQIGNTRIRPWPRTTGRDQLHYPRGKHSRHLFLPPGPGKFRGDLTSCELFWHGSWTTIVHL